MKRRGIFALCLLASMMMFGCVSMLESLTIAMDERPKSEQFKEAINANNMRMIKKLIKKSSPEEREKGLFLVINASSFDFLVKQEEAVRLFLEAGVDASGRALVAACSSGTTGTVKALLEKGADVNARVGERTALGSAVWEGAASTVALLIQYGADVNAQHNGKTPLYIAQVEIKELRTSVAIVNLLRSEGAKPAKREEAAIQKVIQAEELKKRLEPASENFYKEVIYRRGTPIKTGDEFLIDKNRIEVLDRTTSQAGYTYLVADYFAKDSALDYVRSFYYGRMYLGDGTRYCFYIVSKNEMTLHKNYSYTNQANYITSVNDLKLTCIGKGKYQQNYQDVECYMFALDAEL